MYTRFVYVRTNIFFPVPYKFFLGSVSMLNRIKYASFLFIYRNLVIAIKFVSAKHPTHTQHSHLSCTRHTRHTTHSTHVYPADICWPSWWVLSSHSCSLLERSIPCPTIVPNLGVGHKFHLHNIQHSHILIKHIGTSKAWNLTYTKQRCHP